MRFTALLFDFDGCVSDAAPAIVASHRSTIDEFGLDVPDESRLRGLIGPPLQVGLVELLPEIGLPASEVEGVLPEYVRRYRRDYAARSIELAATPDGVVDVVRRLAAVVPLAIATSKPLRYAEPILDAIGLRDCFTVVEGPWGDEDPEPKEVTIGRALRRLGVDPRPSIAMIGDRSHDMIGARAQGLTAVGVTWGIGDRTELTDAGADVVVDAPRELLSLCGCG